MQTFLLFAVVACSAIGLYVARYHYGFYSSESVDETHSKLASCVNKTGIKSEEAKTLRDAPADASLSSGQQNFICCMAEHLISNATLNTTGVQIIIDKHNWGGPDFNLSTVIRSCESDEVKSKNLDSCEKIAPFMHCVYSKARTKSNKTESNSIESEVGTSTEFEVGTSESPQTESLQTESPQTESFQTDSPETETPQTQVPQTESPQTESPAVKPDSKSDGHQLFNNCTHEAGINPEEAKALSDTPANATLTGGQEIFICCMAKGLISNGKLNATSVQNMIDRRGWHHKNIDLSTVINSCESDTVNANNMDSCEKIAPFIHCIHNKVQQKSIELEDSEQINNTESNIII